MKPLSVVVADDVLEIQQLLKMILSAEGHQVLCASTGHEAAQLIRKNPCDLLITDVLMPDGDGLELITEVKRTDGTVRILAISGGGASLDTSYCVKMAKAIGAHAVLAKPFDAQQLLRGVQDAVAA